MCFNQQDPHSNVNFESNGYQEGTFQWPLPPNMRYEPNDYQQTSFQPAQPFVNPPHTYQTNFRQTAYPQYERAQNPRSETPIDPYNFASGMNYGSYFGEGLSPQRNGFVEGEITALGDGEETEEGGAKRAQNPSPEPATGPYHFHHGMNSGPRPSSPFRGDLLPLRGGFLEDNITEISDSEETEGKGARHSGN